MTSSSSMPERISSLEVFSEVVEKIVTQESRLRNVINQVTSIESTLAELTINMEALQHGFNVEVFQPAFAGRSSAEFKQIQHDLKDLQDEFWDFKHWEQQHSKEFGEHRDSTNVKFENMQLQLDSRLADLTQHVTAKSQDLTYTDRRQTSPQYRDGNAILILQEESTSSNPKSCYLTDGEECISAGDVILQTGPQEANSNMRSLSTPDQQLIENSMKAVANSCYRFNGSVWDGAVLIFSQVVHWEDSFLIIFTIVINLLLQCTFCILCSGLAFRDPFLPTHETAQRWRFEVAHDIKNLNTIRETSLASSVCSMDKAISVSSPQVTVLEEIEHWLEPILGGFESGYVMTCIAVSLWFLHITSEVVECLRAIIGYAGIPRESKISFALEEMADQTPRLIILAMQPERGFFMIFMTLLRLGLAIFLGVKGAQWLGNTASLTELVLNCIGLVFIFDVDELLCRLTLTQETQWVLDVLEPLPNVFYERKRWMRSLLPLLVFASVVVMVIIFIHTVVDKTKECMLTIKEVLCGGNQDFVVARQAGTQMYVFTQTNEASQDRLVQDNLLQQFGSHIVEGIVKSGTYNSNGVWQDNYTGNINATHLMSEYGTSRLQSIGVVDIDSLTDFWGLVHGCADEGAFDILRKNGEVPMYRERLQRLRTLEVSIGMTNASSCSDFKSFCHDEMLPLLRIMCPVTCNCQAPRAGLLYGTAMSGCPERACKSLPARMQELSQIPCTDPTPAELENMPGWKAFWLSAFDYTSRRMNWNPEEGVLNLETGETYFKDDLTAMVMMLGCDYLRIDPIARAFCWPTVETTTLRAFCPVTCGCRKQQVQSHCPTQCESYTFTGSSTGS